MSATTDPVDEAKWDRCESADGVHDYRYSHEEKYGTVSRIDVVVCSRCGKVKRHA